MTRTRPLPAHLATLVVTACVAALSACGAPAAPPEPAADGSKAFTGARLFDGTGSAPVDDAVLLVRDGRVVAVGSAREVEIPQGAQRVDLAGKFVVPGLINAHAHVNDVKGLEGGHYDEENLLHQLRLYARYGITTANSLGGDGPEGFRLRDTQDASLDRARLFVAGKIVTAKTVDGAKAEVDENAANHVDFIKIRVDDNLGTTDKMQPEIYQAVIERAHEKGLKVASHLYYLDDAKSLLRAGTNLVAHSIRDQDVDDEVISLLKEKNVCYCPTLSRELSTYVYEGVPDFFEDPFFLKEADPAVLAQLKEPERMEKVKQDKLAQGYKKALVQAERNLKRVSDSGVTIAFGTDTGPAGRFQGYFEHLELGMMADSGLTPKQILMSATGDAARCLGFDDVGSLQKGKWADFVVLEKDPLADIKNMREIDSVWIAGNRVP
jgi:imidazolonepropionase-like amidohydrolase